MEQQHSRPLTRREAIKRGAAFGAGVVWAVPTVQAIGMSRAFASETSPDTDCIYYAIKIEQEKDGDVVIGADCDDIAGQIATPPAKCITTPNFTLGTVLAGGCDLIDKTKQVVDDGADWVIILPPGCRFVDDTTFLQVKTSTSCFAVAPASIQYLSTGNRYVFTNPTVTGQDISHIEGIICCSPNG
jgi:hypothetical protein